MRSADDLIKKQDTIKSRHGSVGGSADKIKLLKVSH